MNLNIDAAADFYVAGGTLRANTPSYVDRPADEELIELTLKGEFCYVLTSRQMGKSSLMIRTARRLQEEGVRSVIVDLTNLGTEVSIEQWSLGFLNLVKRRLRLSVDLEAWWQDQAGVGYLQRFINFLHDVLLTEVEGQVVIFIDEIDTTLNLDFSDDFFAAIRFIYNARATDPAYERLTFVLLGVALPADLIKDRKRTPFNIGQRINLGDFSREDAQVLRQGLATVYPEQAESIFNRIFYWTNGHPYLTQKLCLSVIETNSQKETSNGEWTDARVDSLVEQLFLAKEASKETNLQFVRDYVRNNPQPRVLLTLYRNVYRGKIIQEDERSLTQNQLKLFGLVRVEDTTLKVRNEIYSRVFNLDWIKDNMPVDWGRRITIASVAVVLVVLIAFFFLQQRQLELTEQAQVYTNDFRTNDNPNSRLISLAGLFDLPDFKGQAEKLFYDELTTPEERVALFESADPAIVGSKLTTVVRGLYTDLRNNETDNGLLLAMSEPLQKVNDLRAGNLANEIEQWLQGRAYFESGEYLEAVTTYNNVINLANDQNPGIYFDRGMAYTALGLDSSYTGDRSKVISNALDDFEKTLILDPNRASRVQQVIINSSELYDAVIAGGQSYPAVAVLIPTPTNTPTPTPTFTLTPTPTSTPTPTLTPTPEPSATPTTLLPTSTPAEALLADTATPTPTDTPTPTVTPTSTPQPATIIYVQSNSQTHDLGVVSSSGELLNARLHGRAAAPAWSPNGDRVAFYGEPGISEFGGVYAQGTGIWIMDIQSGSVQLLFQVDHVTNMAWSPDGGKLALELGPPNVAHQVYVIDAKDGHEIDRFPGEQPAWSPDGQELVVKSCAPECGLWRVGFDGGSGKRITDDSTDSYPSWSRTNNYLVFSSRFRDSDWEIYRLDLDTDEPPVRLTNRPGTDTTPVFSPDGLEIYFRTDVFGPWRIMAMAVDGRNERIIVDNVGASDDWGLARPAVR